MNDKFRRTPTLESKYRQRFAETNTFVETMFPHGYKKSPTGKATPRARFEAIAVGVRKALDERPNLPTTPKVRNQLKQWLETPEFREVTGSDGANVIARLRARIDYIYNHLLSVK